ncbi:MAG TPA: XTP/dITP diphosphatase [Dissulfurispiraceae bacterium]|nr:XTP/dITP diphosphatase [Dissulfurispiraceae bacterium]
MEIVLATRNKNKIEEISRMLNGMDIKLLTLDDFPNCPEVVEDSDTFEGNALKKAVAITRCTNKAAVSDDSGLEVYELHGAPGVMSARYAGIEADDNANNNKLLAEMKDLTLEKRRGRFVCVIALAYPHGEINIFEGIVEGRINEFPVGTKGFGYDPLFCPQGSNKSFGQMSPGEKDEISHRSIALRKFANHIKSHTL